MTEWADLVVAATVGTASRPVDLAATPEPVRTAAPPGADLAGSLLDAAVAFELARRAGARPATATVPEPPAVDPRPVVSPLAAELLRVALVDRDVEIAAVALADLARAGRRLPDLLVPVALALAARHVDLRPATAAACGPVAAWLGRRNPAWAWATAVAGAAPARFDPAVWETGTRGERVAQLSALATDDRADAARWLAASWSTTAPDEREDLLRVLGPLPPPEAEPLLEATLTDRRAAVRELAADLLGRLDGSAFRARAASRARALLRTERRGLRRVLVVDPPAPFEAVDRRDGLQELTAPTGALGRTAGPVAARVRQVVAASPVVVWPEATGLTWRQLVTAPLEAFGADVHAGWVAAARREGAADLAAALLAGSTEEVVHRHRADLVGVLPPTQRRAAVVEALGDRVTADAAGLLAVVPRPWDDELALAVDRWLRRAATVPPGRDVLAVLPLAGRAAPPTPERSAAWRAAADRAPTGAIWPRAARSAADTLDLRRRLHEELR